MECEMSALNIPTVDYAHYQDDVHLSSIYTHLYSHQASSQKSDSLDKSHTDFAFYSALH